MNRHPALSLELADEARDLRNYAQELLVSGDAAGAVEVRSQAMHLDGWVDHVKELEGEAQTLASILDDLKCPSVDNLQLVVDTMRAESEGIEELLLELFPPVRDVTGRTITEPAKSATLVTVRDRVWTLCGSVLEIDTYSGIDAAIAEVKKRVKASRVLEAQVEELREVVTREVRADALDRIAEVDLQLKSTVVVTSKETSKNALNARKAAWLDEVLDRCPVSRELVEKVYELLDQDIVGWQVRFSLIYELSAALAEQVRPAPAGAPPAPASVEADKARESDKRQVLQAALERRDAAQRARASMTADHPLQLAYEAELEAAYRAAKPKSKVPRIEGNKDRLDVEKASKAIQDKVYQEIHGRFAAKVKAVVDEAEAELVSSSAAVRDAAIKVTPRPTKDAANLIATVYPSTYSTQTAPDSYARAMARIYLDDAKAACLGIEAELVDDFSGVGKLRAIRLIGNVELLDIEAMKFTGLDQPERVRRAWKYGANPRVYWPSLPHGYEAEHGFDQFGAML